MESQNKNAQSRNKRGEDGWTILETLIVIAIVLILTATVGFMGFKNIDKAKQVTARSQVEAFSIALKSYYLDTGMYPSAEQGLAALWEKPTTSPMPDDWAGPYLDKRVPQDPWKHDYVYAVPGPNGLPFSVASYGADGAEGGEGYDADITSW